MRQAMHAVNMCLGATMALVCPVRHRRFHHNKNHDMLEGSCHAQDKPYALFGACLGAIVAYELARVVEAKALAPPPVALFVAVVSPPHLYAGAVTQLYLPPGGPTGVTAAAAEGVLAKLRSWRDLPRETVMLARSHVSLLVLVECSGGVRPKVRLKGAADGLFVRIFILQAGVVPRLTLLTTS